jgi:membrane protease YdiL (CAAX protease family)
MAHFATKRYSYWGQLSILAIFCGGGLIFGGVLSLLPLLGKFHLKDFSGGSSTAIMDKLLVPENANALRWMQFISTLFLFFLPPFFYALVCHRKPWLHLGFTHRVDVKQAGLIILIMFACLPIVGALQELTEMLPWSKAWLLQFKEAEDAYNRQIAVIARMNGFGDYLLSVIVIAFLPAVFEETMFRGGLQNLLSRWFKKPVLAIVVTAIIFSAVHGSYLGFLSRFALGFVLGWVYYRTGNIWLNIIGHFFNNAFAITMLYISTKPGAKTDPSKIDDHFPLWIGLIGIAAVVGLFMYFEKISKNDIDRPGEEVLIPGYIDFNNPFLADAENNGNTHQL